MIAEALNKLLRASDLTVAEAEGLMCHIMDGQVPPVSLAALLTALRLKGESVPEIAGFAKAMRARAVRIEPRRTGLVDTCGTGADARQTFNISTAAALVAAAMGIPVAKHGNRAVSSRCGSADVLEALGVDLDLAPAEVAALIDDIGIGFLFAPSCHPAMKHAAPVRKELGVRTVFNLLGPLTNPAGVKRQLLGVFHPDLTEPICRVLQSLGARKAFVVHGLDGTDEVSITAETRVSALEGGKVRNFQFQPEDAGLSRANLADLEGGTPEQNAALIRDIFRGESGARHDAVALNAGFVAVAAGKAESIAEGVQAASAAIRDGRAGRKLDQLKQASRTRAGAVS